MTVQRLAKTAPPTVSVGPNSTAEPKDRGGADVAPPSRAAPFWKASSRLAALSKSTAGPSTPAPNGPLAAAKPKNLRYRLLNVRYSTRTARTATLRIARRLALGPTTLIRAFERLVSSIDGFLLLRYGWITWAKLPPVVLTVEERKALELLTRRRTTAQALASRARSC